eukprot:CAMPEP_0170253652 /NCGR_PEP_ID=MMETSP0116_2-20130129/26668_1 /TAXON_ID=400756 /ORGANISM="Durinskia baltica, Strain CSIRO CS-38" /LENGTH=164 /DNA_ID=CAMNT_0010504639 /DNA_START=16 /DNA_END=508 /DNA_ORIENTATION=-
MLRGCIESSASGANGHMSDLGCLAKSRGISQKPGRRERCKHRPKLSLLNHAGLNHVVAVPLHAAEYLHEQECVVSAGDKAHRAQHSKGRSTLRPLPADIHGAQEEGCADDEQHQRQRELLPRDFGASEGRRVVMQVLVLVCGPLAHLTGPRDAGRRPLGADAFV